jgi:hypothetical protein
MEILSKILRVAFYLPLFFQIGCNLLVNGATNFGTTQAFNTVRGGFAKVLVIEPIQNLDTYSRLQFWPFQNSIGNNISPELLQTLNDKVSEAIGGGMFFKAGMKVLVMKGEVIHIYQGILTDSIIVRVQLLDGKTGNSLGKANVEGREEGLLGIKEAASGVALGVVELLNKYR